MSETNNIVDTKDNGEQKKKQKPGLNAVRPDDYIEQKFKEMARDMNLSQTDMFNRMFWSFINDQQSERKELALSLESEIDLISKDLGSILNHFKTITEKAQNTIISIKTNSEQTEKNLNLDIDTLNKRVEELSKRNDELEKLNSTFDEIKAGLETKNKELTESLADTKDKLKAANELNKSKDTEITDLNKQVVKNSKELEEKIATLSNSNALMGKEIHRLKEDISSKDTTISSLEKSKSSLNDTIRTLDELKKSEINAIEAKHLLTISELESKLKSSEESKTNDLRQSESNLRTQLEADKKMALADIKLELADLKGKYAEALTELNILKVANNKRTIKK